MAGKGQPPKNPEDLRKNRTVMFSDIEKEKIDKARGREGFGSFVRHAALEKAEKMLNKK